MPLIAKNNLFHFISLLSLSLTLTQSRCHSKIVRIAPTLWIEREKNKVSIQKCFRNRYFNWLIAIETFFSLSLSRSVHPFSVSKIKLCARTNLAGWWIVVNNWLESSVIAARQSNKAESETRRRRSSVFMFYSSDCAVISRNFPLNNNELGHSHT